MNSIYDATDPIWFEFYKTLPIEDKLELQQQAESTVIGFNLIQKKYAELVNKEITEGFPLLTKIYEEDFQSSSLYSDFKNNEAINFESLKDLIINSITKKNEFNFQVIKINSFNSSETFEKWIGLICFKDELIHKEWCEASINRKIRKKILKVLITKRNLSNMKEWIKTGIVNVSPRIHLQFNKVFSDKTLLKTLIYICNLNKQTQSQN